MDSTDKRRAGTYFQFELTVFEAGYLAGLLDRELASPRSSEVPLQLGYRLCNEGLAADRRAIETANARYLGRRDP